MSGILTDVLPSPVCDDPDDPVTSPAVFEALRRANEAVKVAEARARAAEQRADDLVQRTVQLLATVEARVAAADARIRAAEEQIAAERRVAAALRDELSGERRVVEAMEHHAADLIAAAEERARDSDDRLRSLCDVLHAALASQETRTPHAQGPSSMH
jgi:hypothetical protein